MNQPADVDPTRRTLGDTGLGYWQEDRCKTWQDKESNAADCHFDLQDTGKANSEADRDEATIEVHAGNETQVNSSSVAVRRSRRTFRVRFSGTGPRCPWC